jgi:NAD(P)-dependent dehydrogenase (short-subunit alcohol dehydrogenase family)
LRTAIVTGGGRGIGAACVRALAADGYRVFAVARSKDQLDEVAASAPGDVVPVAMDVADPSAVEALVEQAGEVDVLINNAAILHLSRIVDADPADWERALRINAFGAFLVLQPVLRGMLQRNRGRVIAVSSSAAVGHGPTMGSYCASKAAFEQLHAVAAAECMGTDVKLIVFWPGGVDTHMQEQLRGESFPFHEMAREIAAKGMLRDPAVVADRVMELVRDESIASGSRVDMDGERDRIGLGP